jgi:hypothetical protein
LNLIGGEEGGERKGGGRRVELAREGGPSSGEIGQGERGRSRPMRTSQMGWGSAWLCDVAREERGLGSDVGSCGDHANFARL